MNIIGVVLVVVVVVCVVVIVLATQKTRSEFWERPPDGTEYSFKATPVGIDSTRVVYMFRSPSGEEARGIVERVARTPAAVAACLQFLEDEPYPPYLLVGLSSGNPDKVKLYADLGEMQGRIEGREITLDGKSTGRTYERLSTSGVFERAPELQRVYEAVVPAYLTRQFDHSQTMLKYTAGAPPAISLRFKANVAAAGLVDSEITTAFRRAHLFSDELELWIRQMRRAGHTPSWLQMSPSELAIYYRTRWQG